MLRVLPCGSGLLGELEVENGGGQVVRTGRAEATGAPRDLAHRARAPGPDRSPGERALASQAACHGDEDSQVYVAQLRALGEGVVVTRGRAYAVDLEQDELDIDRFETLSRRTASPSRWGPQSTPGGARSLALWRGAPLADFTYEEFAQSEIARSRRSASSHSRHASMQSSPSTAARRSYPSCDRWSAPPFGSGSERSRCRPLPVGPPSGCARGVSGCSPHTARRARPRAQPATSGPPAGDPRARRSPRPGLLLPDPADRARRRKGGMCVAGGVLLAAAAVAAVLVVTAKRDGSGVASVVEGSSVAAVDSSSARVVGVYGRSKPGRDLGRRRLCLGLSVDDRTLSPASIPGWTPCGRSAWERSPLTSLRAQGACGSGSEGGYATRRSPAGWRHLSRVDGRPARDRRLSRSPTPGPLRLKRRAPASRGCRWRRLGNRSRRRRRAYRPEGGSASPPRSGRRRRRWRSARETGPRPRLTPEPSQYPARQAGRAAEVAIASSEPDRACGRSGLGLGDRPSGRDPMEDRPRATPVQRTIDVGEGADSVTVGGGYVWVANSLTGTLSRVDPRSNRVDRRSRSAPSHLRLVRRRSRGLPSPAADAAPPLAASLGTLSRCRSPSAAGCTRGQILRSSSLPRICRSRAARFLTVQMSEAILFVLRRHRFRAGAFSLAYQSCDDSTAQTGLFDPTKCGRNVREYLRNPSVIGVHRPLQLWRAYSPAAGGESRGACPRLAVELGGRLTRLPFQGRRRDLTALHPTGTRTYARIMSPDDAEAAAAAVQLSASVPTAYSSSMTRASPYAFYFRRAANRLGHDIVGDRGWDPVRPVTGGLARRVAPRVLMPSISADCSTAALRVFSRLCAGRFPRRRSSAAPACCRRDSCSCRRATRLSRDVRGDSRPRQRTPRACRTGFVHDFAATQAAPRRRRRRRLRGPGNRGAAGCDRAVRRDEGGCSARALPDEDPQRAPRKPCDRREWRSHARRP